MAKLSNKKATELFGTVHEEIMQARIKIWQMRDQPKISIAEIDDILSKLCIVAPEKAVKCFGVKE